MGKIQYAEMKIEDFIKMLQEELKNGTTKVLVNGTVLANKDNSILISNERQW